ncbi:MerR family transcriptional regulator [Qipengyuania sp. 902]|uniref:MerR family transcriptional regulator n=1 Tax=Qipengyuania sp. 902 TaxID=3417565 RepID=UPI003EBC0292
MAQFDDGKEAGALRTIGEVAKATGIKAHVLRYWEQQFPMLKPLTRSGGRRYYRPEDVELVERIDRLVNREGYTLKGAKAALKGVPDQQAAAQQFDADSYWGAADILPRLKAIRDDLRAALSQASA